MSNNADNLIGKTCGTCILERLVGRGGMSAVYLAQQTRPFRYVAVKVMLPNIAMSSNIYNEFLARFQREADVIARLEHVNIIPIHEYGEEERLAYLVMPYFSNGSLDNVLARQGTLSLQMTVSYINQAASALDYAHARGVIHRDLKPANFLVHADGRLVLADFGIARMMQAGNISQGSTLTLTGSLLGTPSYMAPEMSLGKQIDFRADIYELGIVIFQMLIGEVPFKGRTFFEVSAQHLNSPLPSLHRINPAIPSAVDDVLQKAAAKQPEDRYSSARSLAQALSTAMTQSDLASKKFFLQTTEYVPPNGQRNSLPPGPRAPLPVQKAKRTKRLWPIFVGIFLIILALGGIFINSLIRAFSYQSQADQAQAVIQKFYDDVNKRDYPTAYYLWNKDYQNSTDYCQFLSEYPQTNHYQIMSFDKITQLPNDTFNIATTIQSGAGDNYPRTYIVGLKNGTWKILPGSSNEKGACTLPTPPTQSTVPATSSSSTTQQAEAVIHQYYTDINNRDYGSAYYLWKSNLQHRCLENCINGYRAFVNGYANTERDDITINSITLNGDSTVTIKITINATEETTTGIQKKPYPDRQYTVDQLQNGLWEISSP